MKPLKSSWQREVGRAEEGGRAGQDLLSLMGCRNSLQYMSPEDNDHDLKQSFMSQKSTCIRRVKNGRHLKEYQF